MPAFSSLSCSSEQLRALDAEVERLVREEGVDASECELGCVVRLDRGYPAVLTERQVLRAEHAVALAKEDLVKPAVGDWVCVRVPTSHSFGVISRVLPRESDIARWRGSSRGERQTLAANVHLVLIACALGGRALDVNRLARSVVVSYDCGAEAAVVLTKADRVEPDELREAIGLVRATLGERVRVVATCAGGSDRAGLEEAAREAGAAWGLDAVRGLVPRGVVAMVLGESGAGKSTLLNALLGTQTLKTGGVRERDDRGRHTTVARRMVALPTGGVVVDEPGLRSLPLIGHERGLARAFPEVSAAAERCKFRDCTHEGEPGCALAEAVAAGAVTPQRADAYRALAAEMRRSAGMLDPDVVM